MSAASLSTTVRRAFARPGIPLSPEGDSPQPEVLMDIGYICQCGVQRAPAQDGNDNVNAVRRCQRPRIWMAWMR